MVTPKLGGWLRGIGLYLRSSETNAGFLGLYTRRFEHFLHGIIFDNINYDTYWDKFYFKILADFPDYIPPTKNIATRKNFQNQDVVIIVSILLIIFSHNFVNMHP